MTYYKPGTVAKATVCGQRNVTAFRRADDCWTTDVMVDGWFMQGDADVTDVRPLVVLDLRDFPREVVDEAFSAAGVRLAAGWPHLAAVLRDIADQIEAQTKPPRIPEPGCGALVKASCVHGDAVKTWVRISDLWYVVDAARADAPDGWDDLVDPVLVREGV